MDKRGMVEFLMMSAKSERGTWAAELQERCESDPEQEMALLLVELACDLTERDKRFFLLVRAQADLKKTHGIPYRADFLLVAPNVGMAVIEVDGLAYHGDQAAFKRDRRRDRAFAAIDLPVLRFTAKEIAGERERVYCELRDFLLP